MDYSIDNNALQMDNTCDVSGIDPSLLAADDERFLIFSPTKSSYMFMSKDPSLSDGMHTKLEVREKRESSRNFFKLMKVDQKDAYYLYNVATEKFIYVHVNGEGVHGVTGQPADHGDGAKFEFQFEAVKKTGCYKIKNNDNCLFVSSSVAGIPPNHVVHANAYEHDGTDIFQFVLEKKVKEVKIDFDLGNLEKVSKVVADIKVEHQNTTEDEVSIEEPFEESFAKEQGCEFDGLTYRGTYVGGEPGKSADSGEYIMTGENTPHPVQPDDGTHKVKESSKFKLAPGRKATLHRKVEVLVTMVLEETIDAKVKKRRLVQNYEQFFQTSVPRYCLKFLSFRDQKKKQVPVHELSNINYI